MDTVEETQMGQQTDPLPPDIRILVALRARGFRSITDLAAATEIPRPNLSRILRGQRYEDAVKNLRAIARELNMTLDDLVDLLEEARTNPLYLHQYLEPGDMVSEVDGLTVYGRTRSA